MNTLEISRNSNKNISLNSFIPKCWTVTKAVIGTKIGQHHEFVKCTILQDCAFCFKNDMGFYLKLTPPKILI